jgi:deoxyribodipyrimidine photolyase-related protein
MRALLLYPNQLFEAAVKLPKDTVFFLIEDERFFRRFRFHKHKLVLHRASMQAFRERLLIKGYQVHYIESERATSVAAALDFVVAAGLSDLATYELNDRPLEEALRAFAAEAELDLTILPSPQFLTPEKVRTAHFSKSNPRFDEFYQAQRRRLEVLVDQDGVPDGGSWSFHSRGTAVPNSVQIPEPALSPENRYLEEAREYVESNFPKNPGDTSLFSFPVTHADAEEWLEEFLDQRLPRFTVYNDAFSRDRVLLFHSLLSPLLNIGLLTPEFVLKETLRFAEERGTAIQQLEPFIRRLIGDREYARGQYMVQPERSSFHGFNYLPRQFWTATTGLEPVDFAIQKALDLAYNPEGERRTVATLMTLLRIAPPDMYQWFMSMYLDAYDWALIPHLNNLTLVDTVTLIKQGDYTVGPWRDMWDALLWTFVDDFRDEVAESPRGAEYVALVDRMGESALAARRAIATEYASSLGLVLS